MLSPPSSDRSLPYYAVIIFTVGSNLRHDNVVHIDPDSFEVGADQQQSSAAGQYRSAEDEGNKNIGRERGVYKALGANTNYAIHALLLAQR